MEGKKPITISMSGLFLIITILVIAVMGVYIYMQDQNAKLEVAKLEEDKASLQNTVNELQGKVDEVAAAVKEPTKNSSTTNTKNNNSSISDNKSSSKENVIANKLIGTWKADSAIDSQGNEVGLSDIWGTGISSSNSMKFKDNGILEYSIGITMSDADGKYTIEGNTINIGIPNDMNQLNWSKLTYDTENNVLKGIENNGEYTVTYVRK